MFFSFVCIIIYFGKLPVYDNDKWYVHEHWNVGKKKWEKIVELLNKTMNIANIVIYTLYTLPWNVS